MPIPLEIVRPTRRRWLALAAGLGTSARAQMPVAGKPKPLDLAEFEPRSMLHAPETRVPRARFPVIDFHTHLTFPDPVEEKPRLPMKPEQLLEVMDRRNVRVMVNLTGGYGKALEETLGALQAPHPGRFIVFTQPWFTRIGEPAYPKFQAEEIERARRAGARGLKVLKTLGLTLREKGGTGALVRVDDARFDPMWEAAGALKMPVAIHTSDPEAFFLPIDRHNERFEELNAHPDWSFHGKDFPGDRELQEARFRVLTRHPKTTFVVLHVGNAENLPYIS